jgi:TRAP transporter T-component
VVLRLGLVLALAVTLGGCVSNMVGGVAADTLSAAIRNESDPGMVQDGLPAYLLLVDGLIYEHPQSSGLLTAGAQLFALYGSRFVADGVRAEQLTQKAYDYGVRAICLAHSPACSWGDLSYDDFVTALQEVSGKDKAALYAYATGWLSHLQATSSDWSAVADLPRVEAVLERLLALDETYDHGGVHTYLGILNSLRPPALGGRPEVARAHFERALELSGGLDLSVKVEYARRYARLVFDQELHDRLLREVEAAPVEAPGLTLVNVLAKREAAKLLASSAEYF